MRPIEEFVRETANSIVLGVGGIVHKLSGGKYPEHLFSKTVPHPFIGTDVKIVRQSDDTTAIAKFNPDGTISDKEFTVLIATDMHVDRDNKLIYKAMDMLYKHIADVKPDLVLFTGDFLVTDYQQLDSVQFARFMEDIGIYWAFVFGNHEAREEKEFHKYFMLKNLTKYEHCLTKIGPSDLFGFGNFFIEILNADGKVSQCLSLFDSGRDIYPRYCKEYNLPEEYANSYDFIKENQIVWYENHIKALQNKQGDVKSMLFMHIPVPEYKEIMDFDENEKPIPTGKPTGKGEVIYGSMHENVGCSKYNSGLFERARKVGATAFFSGHDHINDFAAMYKGVLLAYVQMTGYEIYHMGDKFGLPEEEWMQGTTVVKINPDGNFRLKQNFTSKFLK